ALLAGGSPLVTLFPFILGGVDHVSHGIAVLQPGREDEGLQGRTGLEPITAPVGSVHVEVQFRVSLAIFRGVVGVLGHGADLAAAVLDTYHGRSSTGW